MARQQPSSYMGLATSTFRGCHIEGDASGVSGSADVTPPPGSESRPKSIIRNSGSSRIHESPEVSGSFPVYSVRRGFPVEQTTRGTGHAGALGTSTRCVSRVSSVFPTRSPLPQGDVFTFKLDQPIVTLTQPHRGISDSLRRLSTSVRRVSSTGFAAPSDAEAKAQLLTLLDEFRKSGDLLQRLCDHWQVPTDMQQRRLGVEHTSLSPAHQDAAHRSPAMNHGPPGPLRISIPTDSMMPNCLN